MTARGRRASIVDADLPPDIMERCVRTVADAGTPLGLWDAADLLNPRDGVPKDSRRREWKAWSARHLATLRVLVDAVDAGYIRVVEATLDENGYHETFECTDLGREWLRQQSGDGAGGGS